MIDFYASEPHFLDHLAPIVRAMGQKRILVGRGLLDHARRRGLVATADGGDPSRPVVVASNTDTKRMRKLGRTRIAFIEHGIGQSYAGDPHAASIGAYAGGKDRGDLGLFMVPNEHAASRFRATYPGNRTVIVGSPKLDEAPAYEPGPKPVVAVSFHWDCSVVPETRSSRKEYWGAIQALARTHTVIGHGHPRAFLMDRLDTYYRRAGIEVVTDFAEVLRRASVYVCDNSSSLYEFAATGRPVVVLNASWYRKQVHHGLRFWDAADVGIQVDRAEDFAAAIETALKDPPKRQAARERALDIVYAYRSGGAVRAAGAITEWAGLAVAA